MSTAAATKDAPRTSEKASGNGFFHKLYTSRFSIDFVGRRRLWYTIAIAMIVVSFLAIAVRGLNLGIEFKGGSVFTVPVSQVDDGTVGRIRSAAEGSGVSDVSDAQVTTVGGGSVRVQTRSLSTDEVVQMRQALRLPTGKRQTVRAFFHAFHQGFGVQAFHRRGVVKQRGRAISHRMEKVGAHPVKHRHEVVADDLHSVLAQIAQTFLIVLNVLLALGRAELDRLVHVDALDDINIEAVLRRLRLDRSDARLRPNLARRQIVQRPNDAAHARNLADLFEGDGVIAFTIPAKSGFHV